MYSGMTPKALEWQKKIRKFVNDELIPLFFLPITTPSKDCNLSLFPSLTLTKTSTVSPLEKLGYFFSCGSSILSIIFFITSFF